MCWDINVNVKYKSGFPFRRNGVTSEVLKDLHEKWEFVEAATIYDKKKLELIKLLD